MYVLYLVMKCVVCFFQGFVTGGKDGVVVVWDMFFEHCLKAFKVERTVMNYGSILLDDCPPIRSIHTNATRILIGTGNDEVFRQHLIIIIAFIIHLQLRKLRRICNDE